MGAKPERQVPVRLATDVQGVRLRELSPVAVRGRDDRVDEAALRDLFQLLAAEQDNLETVQQYRKERGI
jgi:hypothetical protein